jgi:hypothetical protein
MLKSLLLSTETYARHEIRTQPISSACLTAMLSRFFVRHYFGGTFGRERLVSQRQNKNSY